MASYIDIEDRTIPKKAVPGDAIRYSSYRDTGTIFLGWDGELIPNPDLSGSGYLTIPLKVTKHFKNAVKYYRRMLKQYGISIVLRGSDDWVVKKYGRRLPKGWRVIYYPDEEIEDQIYIKFDADRGAIFNLFATYDEIKSYYDKLDEPIVSYHLHLKTDDSKDWMRYEQSRDIKLPPTWRCRNIASGGYKVTSECHGPKSDRKAALAAIKEYYDGYGGGVEYKLEKIEDSH